MEHIRAHWQGGEYGVVEVGEFFCSAKGKESKIIELVRSEVGFKADSNPVPQQRLSLKLCACGSR